MKFSLIKMIFRRYRKIMISLVMIAALAIALLNGMFNAWESMDLSLKAYLTEYGIADAVISTEITETDVAEKIRQMDGVSRVVARLTGSSQIITSSGNVLTAQIISMDNEDILRLHHWEDQEVRTGNYVLADHWFAKHNGISAGDVLQIRTGEEEYRAFTVAAVISAPETMERTKLSLGGNYYPDFGFLYAPISLLESETEKEILRMTEEWKEKEEEYLKAEKELQDAWDEGQAGLKEAREELEKQEKEFGEKKKELQEQIRQLTGGRVQLMLGRKELDDAEKTAGEQKTQLEQTLERTEEQLLEMEDRMAELTEIRNDLSSLLIRLEDARGRLSVSRDLISGKTAELKAALVTMKSARTIWRQIRASDGESGLPAAISEQGKATAAEIEAALAARGITPENLDDWISQAENGVNQLENGKNRIQAGIVQINREYLPEIQSFLEETEQGLETVTEVHQALRDGIAEMETGLRTISDFEQEAPGNREEIDRKLQELEDGLQAIYSGMEEGDSALAESWEQLEEKDTEAVTAHKDAETELAEGARSLQEAWDELTAWEGYTPLRNEFLIWFDPDVEDHRLALKAVEEALEVPVQNSELYSDSRVAKNIHDNLDPMWTMSVLIPLLFVGIMMVVLFLFLSIMIRQSRQSIGILRALGFGTADIRRAFSISCMILMLLASALGGGFSVGITYLFNQYYQEFFSMPEYVYSFNVFVFGLSIAGFILLALGAVALMSGALGRIHPAEAVSRAVASSPKIGRLTRVLLRRVEPLSKFSLLSLRRNPFRFITSVICISGAVSLIFASFSFIVSKNEVLIDVFGRQFRYDGQIIFVDEPGEGLEDRIRQMESVSEAERFWARQDDISFEGQSIRGTIMFLEPETSMILLTDTRGQPMAYPSEGIVLAEHYAKLLGVKTGDKVTVGETEVTVAGISRQLAMYIQFLPSSDVDRFRKAEQTGWLIRLKEGADEKEIQSALNREEGYATILWQSMTQRGYSELFEEFDLYSWLLVFLCALVGFFIVVNTGRNNLQEQKLSLSVLRVVGFQHRQISLRWFLQSLLFLVCSLLLGFAVGRITAVESLKLLSNSVRQLEYIPSFYQYMWTAICTFAFILAGHLITMRDMRKWDLVENTKGRE